MGMTKGQMVLALGMLITGSLNTITTNVANQRKSKGTTSPSTMWGNLNHQDEEVKEFNHPFVQAEIMFMGELLCMFTYLATRPRGDASPEEANRSRKDYLWFAIPAMCDMCGTGLMYTGLCLSYASIFQMLRGSSVIFTAAISATFLRRKLMPFHWFSVFLVVLGVAVVGVASLQGGQEGTKTQSSVLLGNIIIIVAQFVVAIQMCVEEKIMSWYDTPALKAVGTEGFFGMVILGLVLIPMNFIKVGGYPIENFPDAMVQMKNNWVIILAMAGNMLSIAFFNFFGISVTKSMSASHRMVLDSVRTVIVWAVSLGLGWEKFHGLQLLGFFFLTVGTGAFNEIIKLPFFSYQKNTVEAEENLKADLQANKVDDAILTEG